jgi:hypothetical protein
LTWPNGECGALIAAAQNAGVLKGEGDRPTDRLTERPTDRASHLGG